MLVLNKVGGNEDERPNDGGIFLINFVHASLLLLLIVFLLTIHLMTIKSHKKHSKVLFEANLRHAIRDLIAFIRTLYYR